MNKFNRRCLIHPFIQQRPAGFRLSQQLGHGITLHLLLQPISRLLLPEITVPQALGAVLVDLDHYRPIALLADREANTVAQ